MAGKKGGPNAKQVAGLAKKAESAAKKKAETDKFAEEQEKASWADGANLRGKARQDAANAKADEAARRKREKAELEAAEDQALGKGGKPKVVKKKGNKKIDDLSLLEDALQSAAEKKVKAKRAVLLRKQQEEKEAAAAAAAAETAEIDPLLRNTDDMIGDDAGGRDANKARMQDEGTSGIDAALGKLGVSEAASSAKALYKEFEAKQLPQIKEDFPGLRLTQQKEKVWNLWKKHPDNPVNRRI